MMHGCIKIMTSKKVRFKAIPTVIDVSPRIDKIPGKLLMPDDAPFPYSVSI